MNFLKYGLGPFVSGILFSIGLGVSGMTESKNIIGFLDIFGDWQPELILVMGGALVIYSILFPLITRKPSPLFSDKFALPTDNAINKTLLLGATLFGVGWGVTGLCPGPGITALVSGKMNAIIFVITMLIGMAIGRSNYIAELIKKAN